MKPLFSLFILAALFLTACSSASAPSFGGTWNLVSYNGIPAAPGVNTSIEFKDGKVNGNVGCNGFSGEYKLKGATIKFDKMMSTLMACTDPIATQELVAFATLSQSASFVLNGDTLTVTSADGASVIVLTQK